MTDDTEPTRSDTLTRSGDSPSVRWRCVECDATWGALLGKFPCCEAAQMDHAKIVKEVAEVQWHEVTEPETNSPVGSSTFHEYDCKLEPNCGCKRTAHRWWCDHCEAIAPENNINYHLQNPCYGDWHEVKVSFEIKSEPEITRLDELAAAIRLAYDKQNRDQASLKSWSYLSDESRNRWRAITKETLAWLDEDARRRLVNRNDLGASDIWYIRTVLGFERSDYEEEEK